MQFFADLHGPRVYMCIYLPRRIIIIIIITFFSIHHGNTITGTTRCARINSRAETEQKIEIRNRLFILSLFIYEFFFYVFFHVGTCCTRSVHTRPYDVFSTTMSCVRSCVRVSTRIGDAFRPTDTLTDDSSAAKRWKKGLPESTGGYTFICACVCVHTHRCLQMIPRLMQDTNVC